MGKLTETLPEIDDKRDELVAVCRKFGVLRLDLFGSAADGSFDPRRSDLDFLVEFGPPRGTNAFHQFFGFQFALEELFGRKIDLVDTTAMRNPYFIESVNRSRRPLYAA